MTEKRKRMNTILIGGEEVVFKDLPDGYFYKGRFLTPNKCFSALVADKEIDVMEFPKGKWVYDNIAYRSLRQLYECNELEIEMPYNELRRRYWEANITHEECEPTMYVYDMDENRELFETKSAVLIEIEHETELIEDVEDREIRYFESVSNEECLAYLSKSIKDRIAILEAMK